MPHLIDIATLSSYVAMGILGSAPSAGIGLAFFALRIIMQLGSTAKNGSHKITRATLTREGVQLLLWDLGILETD